MSNSKSQTRESNAEASEEEEIVSQSEAELEPPGIETKQQRVGNGVKTQDQAPVNKKMPQQQQQRQLQPQRPLQQPIVQQQQPLVQQQEPQYAPRAEGYRPTAIRESRIKDRPVKAEEKDSAMSIKIQLDLEVEVDLYARVKGDVTIGLM